MGSVIAASFGAGIARGNSTAGDAKAGLALRAGLEREPKRNGGRFGDPAPPRRLTTDYTDDHGWAGIVSVLSVQSVVKRGGQS